MPGCVPAIMACSMTKKLLRKYANLVVVMGVHLKKGQGCIINSSVEQCEFAKIVAEEAYRAGAKWVRIDWNFQEFTKLKYRKESTTTLSKVTVWEEEKAKYNVEALPAVIHIFSDDPDGLSGVNPEKLQKSSIARAKVLKQYRDATEGKSQWTIVAVPSPKWAKKVFPGERTSAAVAKLWDAILKSVRITEDNDPIAEWKAHDETLNRKNEIMSSYDFDYLHYKNKYGTDFKCWLIPKSKWNGGGDKLLDGTFFNPNMPTEEVFISPMKGRAEGTLVSTKPLSYQGQLIDKFSITFKDGKAVSWNAETGADVLDKMFNMDDGAKMLGELALIPYDSPISNTGILFYETLFDENASCHVALGFGFGSSLDGYENMTLEQQHENGINDSFIHVDFMVGSEDLNIDGYTRDGKKVEVFKNGDWAV